MMSSVVTKVCKLSHKQFRAMLKKFRRKKKRQQLAKEREQQELLEQQKRENSPNFKAREEEQLRNEELYEQFQERERARQNRLWLLREEQAQTEFKKKQERLELEKIRKEEERKRILAEFEKQQFVEAQEVEQKEKIKTQKEEALQEALTKLSQEDEPWHNPIAPENYNNSGKEKEKCQFFMKTGACRFGDRCSRGHSYPIISSTILIRGMYTHLSIGQNSRDDYDTDAALEYEDKERYQDFLNFYDDVLPEFKRYGKVLQFKVCNNHEPHLRGNVYVQYPSEKEAVEAYKGFNGRFYAGKQLTCEFTHVVKWRSAICGLFARNKCPKGIECNFLHCFKNPGKEFFMADKDLLPLETFRNSQRNEDKQRHESSHRSSSHRDYGHKDDYLDGRNSRRDSTRSSYRDRRDGSEERGSHRSSHYKTPGDKYDSHSSHKCRKRRSRSKSGSPYTSDEENERSNSSSKRKHKKKHSKKSKRRRSSSESED